MSKPRSPQPKIGLSPEQRKLLRYGRLVATVTACVVGVSLAISFLGTGLKSAVVQPVMIDKTIRYALTCRYKLLFAQHVVILAPAEAEAEAVDRTRCPAAFTDAQKMALAH